MNIKSLPSDERPREKLVKYGPRTLTDSELLAIILRTGNKKENVLKLSNKLFIKYNLKSLSRIKITNLKKQLGIGDAKACQIIACFELGKRLAAFKEDKKPTIPPNNDKSILVSIGTSLASGWRDNKVYIRTAELIPKAVDFFNGVPNNLSTKPPIVLIFINNIL